MSILHQSYTGFSRCIIGMSCLIYFYIAYFTKKHNLYMTSLVKRALTAITH